MKWILMVMIVGAWSVQAETKLLFGFDTTDDRENDWNGIFYEKTAQEMTFSGGVVAQKQKSFDALNDVDQTVQFSVAPMGDLLAFNGTVSAQGGSLRVSGNGAGVENTTVGAGESLSFTFSSDVLLCSVRYHGGDPAGQTILVGGVAVAGSPFGDDDFETPVRVSAGDSLTFAQAGAGTYSLQDFEIQVIPEPAMISLVGLGGVLCLLFRPRLSR